MNNTNSLINHCKTITDFVSSVDSFFEIASNQLDVKSLFSFLEANDEYLVYSLKQETAKKLSELVQRVSSTIDSNSVHYQTVKKIGNLVTKSTEIQTKLNAELIKLFKTTEGIQRTIALLRQDRFTNDTTLTEFLRQSIGVLPVVNDTLIQIDPILAMLTLILRNNPAEDKLRSFAADSYTSIFRDDERFEKAYVYLKTPNILIAHLLICSGNWRCQNPENKAFYDEQMAGVFHDNIAFDKGDRLSEEELVLIQKKEGTNPRFPIIKKLEQKNGYYEVKDWCCTPTMSPSETRIDDLFIPSRREEQEIALTHFLKNLTETSAIVQKAYNISPSETAVVAIIGPYGVGKSHFVRQKFSQEKRITVYSLDRLNEVLMTETCRRQDHHFEAMMLTSKLLKQLAEVPVLLTEVAAVDEFRFNRLMGRDYTNRTKIIVEEIAPENITDSIQRYAIREGNTVAGERSKMGAATDSSNDALRFRAQRIESILYNPKVDYTLYCNHSVDNSLVFSQIAIKKNDMLEVHEGKREIFNQLTPQAKK